MHNISEDKEIDKNKVTDYIKKYLAEYGDKKVLVDIVNGTVIKGVFPFKQLKLVLAWCEIHREELLKNWGNAKQQLEINKIKPLV